MTAISDFVADPIGFLRANIVQSLWTGSPLKPVRSLKFAPAPFMGTRLADGLAIPVYRVVPLDQNEALALRANPAARNQDYMNAYFCPYGTDETHAIMLNAAADFMFTTNMDGCTFGVGTATPDGSRRVAHSNVQGQGSNAANKAEQMNILANQGLDHTIVNPGRYQKSRRLADGGDGIKATTIGIRNAATGQWRFIYQQFRVTNQQMNDPMLFTVKFV